MNTLLPQSKWQKSHFIANLFAVLNKKAIFAQKSQFIGIMTQKEIGNAIRQRRKVLGINQQTLADLAGLAINTLVAIERGEGNPQLSTLLSLIDTLGLQIDVNLKQMEYETV